MAVRVLPTPAGPVSVTSRALRSISPTAWSSEARPINAVRGAGIEGIDLDGPFCSRRPSSRTTTRILASHHRMPVAAEHSSELPLPAQGTVSDADRYSKGLAEQTPCTGTRSKGLYEFQRGWSRFMLLICAVG